MRTRASTLVVMVVFALAVASVAVLAARSDDQRLVKLPLASLGGDAADESAAAAASARSPLLYGGPGEYRVEGTLPELPGTAPAYRLGSVTTVGAVAGLARALGFHDEVRAEGNSWVVRSGDRELRVEKLPGLPWYLGPACPETVVSEGGETVVSCSAVSGVGTPISGGSSAGSTGSTGSAGGCPPDADCVVSDPGTVIAPSCPPGVPPCSNGGSGPDPVCTGADSSGWCEVPAPRPTPVPGPTPACPPGTECLVAPASCAPGEKCVEPVPCTPEAGCIAPMPVEKPVRPGDLPSEQDARRLAREAFARLGAGSEGLVVEDGWTTWQARVESTVDGLPVLGLGTSLSIGPKGRIESANGFLAAPDRIGDYPLVGVDAGLRRLTTGFGFGFGPGPQPFVATDHRASQGAATEPAPPECADPTVSCLGPPEQAPMVQVVTGVHLALLQTGGVLVPAHVFELAEGGGTVPVPAVTDEWLDQQASTLED